MDSSLNGFSEHPPLKPDAIGRDQLTRSNCVFPLESENQTFMSADVFRPVADPLARPLRLAVLISGGGTTLENLLTRISDGALAAEVALVVASRPDCKGIARAERANLRCEVVSPKSFGDVGAFSDEIFRLCREQQVDLVTLAGFLSLIRIPDDFKFRVMNIHPALIPAFCGKGFFGQRVHQAALDRGVRVSGCTVHFADNEYDHGPIIVQRCVPVHDDDSPDDLAARVFEAECEAYPVAISLFAAGRLEITGGRLRVCPPGAGESFVEAARRSTE